jgi:hypothetical protein
MTSCSEPFQRDTEAVREQRRRREEGARAVARHDDQLLAWTEHSPPSETTRQGRDESRNFTGLKRDLERYVDGYNLDRPHHGRLTRGRIPADIAYGARKVRTR